MAPPSSRFPPPFVPPLASVFLAIAAVGDVFYFFRTSCSCCCCCRCCYMPCEEMRLLFPGGRRCSAAGAGAPLGTRIRNHGGGHHVYCGVCDDVEPDDSHPARPPAGGVGGVVGAGLFFGIAFLTGAMDFRAVSAAAAPSGSSTKVGADSAAAAATSASAAKAASSAKASSPASAGSSTKASFPVAEPPAPSGGATCPLTLSRGGGGGGGPTGAFQSTPHGPGGARAMEEPLARDGNLGNGSGGGTMPGPSIGSGGGNAAPADAIG